MRAELMAWGLNDAAKVDPGETLLLLIAQSAARVRRYSSLLQAAYEGAPDFDERFKGAGVAALIGHRFAVGGADGRVAVGEAVRGLVELEMAERKLLGDWCVKAVAAGIEERRVRLAERQTDVLEVVVRGALVAAGLGEPERLRVLAALPAVIDDVVGVPG